MKRAFNAIAVLTTLVSLFCARAFAEPYPSRPVRVMVPSSAGGVTDLVARITGNYLSARTNQRFIVENRTGAGADLGCPSAMGALEASLTHASCNRLTFILGAQAPTCLGRLTVGCC